LAGILGGILVGLLSGSHTSVAGPAAGLTAIVAAQIAALGNFNAFLAALVLAGVIQVMLGILKAGSVAAFFPSSVIKGLLAAIGVILILKQIPHAFGHDPDPAGDVAFAQGDGENTFSELVATLFDIQPGAALVGILSIAILAGWDKSKALKKSSVPAPLVVVIFGIVASALMARFAPSLIIESSHLVQVPVAESPAALVGFLQFPDFSVLKSPTVYLAAITIAIVASLETLLNLEAVDNIDPEQRRSPPNRELVAQGIGNLASGLIGGLPMTSVIVRSSVNINARNKTRLSTIIHGSLLLLAVLLAPHLINMIPLACLAAILIMTGLKLASPKLFISMKNEGRQQFWPFIATVTAIVFTDLLKGIVIGLLVAIGFILHSNFRRPLRQVLEHHAFGNLLRIELASQVSFFNRARLALALQDVPHGGHVLLDARNTDYIDPDILDLITDYRTKTAPAHSIKVSLLGFKQHYQQVDDQVQFVDYSTRETRAALSPAEVVEIFRQGNDRFRSGQSVERDLMRQVTGTAPGQAPFAVVLSCIDSRAPVELIFDLGIGDVFSARIAGNIASHRIIGSMEFACAVAGAKLILVLGHTSCGAIKAAVDIFEKGTDPATETGCQHLGTLVGEVQAAIDPEKAQGAPREGEARSEYLDDVAFRNVLRGMDLVRSESPTLDALIAEGKVGLVGGLYDVRTGQVQFFTRQGKPLTTEVQPLPPVSAAAVMA
jgi:carbonic anhydrase/SulP family sulfate permease